MKKITFHLFILSFAGVITFISCKKEKPCEGCINGNKPPIAIAGPDQVITLPTDSVSLDGSASSDADGTISSYLWKKISGPASSNIVYAALAKTIVKSLDRGVYRFELRVTDNGNLPATDTIQITVLDPAQPNRPPVANAGGDQVITLPINTLNIDGAASTDPDNNITSYTWTKISGPSSFNIANTNSIQTQVTNLIEGIYLFELKVTDAGGLFSKDTLLAIVSTQSPNTSCPASNRPVVNAQLIPVGNLSIARTDIAIVTANNKIFFAGGRNASGTYARVDIYDIPAQTWSEAELSIPRSHMAAVAAGNKVFFAGGSVNNAGSWESSSRVDIYDLGAQSWSIAELSQARVEVAAAATGNKVFFAGGYTNLNGPGLPSSRIDIYNISTQSWSTAELSEARGYITPVSSENKVYFGGGDPVNFDHTASNKVDIYDSAMDTWSVSTLNEGKAFFAGIYNNGKIYWAGGATYINVGSSEIFSCEVEIRDVNSQSSSFTNLFEPKQYIKALEKDNKIIFIKHNAIWDFQTSSPWSFDIYDIATNTWSIGTVYPPPLAWPGSWISHNNIIYMAGGYPNGSGFSNQVWKLEF